MLFDDDTRLAFITSFDGPWDAYMEDFFTSGPTLALFDVDLPAHRGLRGPARLAALKAFILGAEETAAAYARNYGGTVKEIRKAQRVNEAFQRVLDDPAAGRGAAASGAEAAARRGRRLAGASGRTHVGSHLRAARAGRPDRGHHRRLRVSEPGASGASRAGHEHAAVRAARRRCSRTGSSIASGCVRSGGRDDLRRSPSARTSSCSTASFRSRRRDGRGRKVSARRRRATRSFRVGDEQGGCRARRA